MPQTIDDTIGEDLDELVKAIPSNLEASAKECIVVTAYLPLRRGL